MGCAKLKREIQEIIVVYKRRFLDQRILNVSTTSNRQLPKWLRNATSVTAETLDESFRDVFIH